MGECAAFVAFFTLGVASLAFAKFKIFFFTRGEGNGLEQTFLGVLFNISLSGSTLVSSIKESLESVDEGNSIANFFRKDNPES